MDEIDQFEVAVFGSEMRLFDQICEHDPDEGVTLRLEGALGRKYAGPAPSGVVEAWRFVSRLAMDFYEVQQSLECLDAIPTYLRSFPYRRLGISRSGYLSYHVENWLNEVYILEKRFVSCLTRVKRGYATSPNADAVSAAVQSGVDLLRSSLEEAREARGEHVHESRLVDRDILLLRGEELQANHRPDRPNEVERMFRRVRKTKASELGELNTLIRATTNRSLAPLCAALVVWDPPTPHLRVPAPV